ncbi:MAG: YicC/YloC family endoribonuclease [Lachnospiraceae bacterium]|nr:YicC/YloC family endoribonuclease [Lachnospiraceae bacterium]
MAESMTGFGRAAAEGAPGRVTVEIKSVNHRYLDLTSKLPRELNFLEPVLRESVGKRIARGKVDVSVSYDANTDETISLQFNPHIAAAYVEAAKEAEKEFDLKNDITAGRLLSLPYVMSTKAKETDEEALQSLFQTAMDQALDAFETARGREGARLVSDLTEKVKELSGHVDTIEKRCPELILGYKERLAERLASFKETEDIDSQRLAQEVTLYADKVAIDEELVRLKSHITETLSTLQSDGEIGRRLDFLSQEMNREANTILSKSTDVEIDAVGVQVKTLIEKIREQIQNLE